MVSWLWVAAALFGGMIIGIFLAALLAANDDGKGGDQDG